MEKVGLKIVDLIHDITQLGYDVQFCGDFTGMIRLEFTDGFNFNFYEHAHLGFPDCERPRLEKEIIESLAAFLKKQKVNEDAKI